MAVYDEVVERFGDSESPALLEQVAKVLLNKGIVFDSQNDWQAELAVYDEVVERFGDSESPSPALSPGCTTRQQRDKHSAAQDRLAAAVAVYDEVVERFGDSESPALLEQVAKALVSKGAPIRQSERSAGQVGCL